MPISSKKRRSAADTLSSSDARSTYSTTTSATTTTTTSTTSSDGSDRSSYSYYSSGSSSVTASGAGAARRGSSKLSSNSSNSSSSTDNLGEQKIRETASSSFDITSSSSTSASHKETADGEAAARASSTATSSHGSSADKLPPSLPLELRRRLSRTVDLQQQQQQDEAEGRGPGEAMLPLDVVRRDPVLSQGAMVPIYGPPPKHQPTVVSKIETSVLQLPPTDAMLEQRRQEGCMPYPSRLTYRMVARPTAVTDIPVGDPQEQDVGAAAEDQAKLRARHEKADARCGCCGMSSQRFWKRRNVVEDRDAARQHINKTVLRGHHVPLVPFATRRQEDLDNVGAPTLEEARRIQEDGVRHMPQADDPMSLAMRKNRTRPSTIFVIKTSHSMGGETVRHCARSNFLAPDEPVAFWMTQLQERPQLLLGEIEESEVFSIASEVSRLSEGDRLLEEPEQLARLEHRIQREQAKIEEEQHLATSAADNAAAGALTTVPSGNVHYYVDPVYGITYDPNKKEARSLLSSMRSAGGSSDSGDAKAEESVRQAQETKRRLRSISPPHVAPTSNAHSPFGFTG